MSNCKPVLTPTVQEENKIARYKEIYVFPYNKDFGRSLVDMDSRTRPNIELSVKFKGRFRKRKYENVRK